MPPPAPRASQGLPADAASLLHLGGRVLALQVASLLAAVGVQWLLARLLGAAAFGDFSYALSWLLALTLLGKGGIEQASLRQLSIYRESGAPAPMRGLVRWGLGRALTGATLLSGALGLVVVFLPNLSPSLRHAFGWACLALPFECLGEVGTAMLRALRRPLLGQALHGLLRRLLHLGLLAALAGAGFAWGAGSAMLAYAATTAAALLLLLAGLWRSLPPAPRQAPAAAEPGRWAADSRRLLASSLLQAAMAKTDILVLGMLAGTTEAGIYAVASRLANFTTFGQTALNTLVAPRFAALHAQGARGELERLARQAARGAAGFAALVGLPLLLGGSAALGAFGPEFPLGSAAVALLVLGQLGGALCGSVGYLLNMSGHQSESIRVLAWALGANLLLLVALIPPFGLTGAALASAASLLLANLALLRKARSLLGIRPAAWSRGAAPPEDRPR